MPFILNWQLFQLHLQKQMSKMTLDMTSALVIYRVLTIEGNVS